MIAENASGCSTIGICRASVISGETVADAYHFTRRYIQQGIAGFHVEDERNPKHSKHVNGLWSIPDQQARIDAARRAQAEPRAMTR